MKNLLTVSLLFIYVASIYCTRGIDVSQLYSTSTYKCIKSNGYIFAIVRAIDPNGALDKNAVQGLTNAISAGLLTDVKLSPCRGKSAQAQAQQLLGKIHRDTYDTVWIEVMPNSLQGCSWSTYDAASNCKYVMDIANVLSGKAKHIGIYSSFQAWKTIFKGDNACPQLAKYPIWYSHDDKEDNFSDFPNFGGWNEPRLKQFDLNATICGAKLNKNYHSSA